MEGTKLKILREEKGLSISQLSELSGISKSYLSLIERDIQRNPSIEILDKIAKTLNVDIDQFIKGNQDGETKISSGMIKGTLKLEIELSEGQLNTQKLRKLKNLIQELNTE
ncbi:helix-turn-helix domain-containing protein [Bacillus sp. UNC438CL73TsuS30]|uniref:helix-turn-helix domain-containing protein n=1 Tax=Bacillus sp. UNC438CL73TsuS30 TaxID=1340434 RepID=UPI00047BC8B5|nr:helix-turn-helix transcriptional regulator [Bacillus sp. UNC438CL73TsuS30]